MAPTAMTNSFADVQYSLLKTFYGLEDFIDLCPNVATIVAQLDNISNELQFRREFMNLDLWNIEVDIPGRSGSWNPFKQSLLEYVDGSEVVHAHIFGNRRYSRKSVITYLNKIKIA